VPLFLNSKDVNNSSEIKLAGFTLVKNPENADLLLNTCHPGKTRE